MVSEKIKNDAIKVFKKEYPYTNPDNFAFGYNLENDEKTMKSIDIYCKVTPKYNTWIKIIDPRFQSYKKELHGTTNSLGVIPLENLSENKYPKIWLSNRTIQKLPESKPIDDTDGNHIPRKYPSCYVLNYSINNF